MFVDIRAEDDIHVGDYLAIWRNEKGHYRARRRRGEEGNGHVHWRTDTIAYQAGISRVSLTKGSLGYYDIDSGYIVGVAKSEPELKSNRSALEVSVRQILHNLGLDPESEDLLETPRRVVDLLLEFNQPCDLAAILKSGFDNADGADGGMVVQSNIPFRGLCEHHMLPFHGHAAIGYLPKKRVVGLSKLTRLTQAAGTQRPSNQEKITNAIADTLHTALETGGVIVVTTAEHTCMAVRGVNSPDVHTTVSSIRGNFVHVPAAREEFFNLVSMSHRH